MALTSVVALVLLSTTALALAVSRPVGHATQLVALGKRCVRDTVQGRLGGGGRTPSVLSRQSGEKVGQRSHDETQGIGTEKLSTVPG